MKVTTVAVHILALAWLAALPRAAAAQGGQVTQVTFSPASPVAPGTAVTVTVAATTPCGAIEINFGDGPPTTFPISTLPLTRTHTYANAGSFTVRARGQGNCGGNVSRVLQVTGLVTGVSVSPSPTRGTPVTVTVTAIPPCAAVQINFGDGAVGRFPATTLPVRQNHTYAQAGAVTIVATGESGCGGQARTNASVAFPSGRGNPTPAPGPVAPKFGPVPRPDLDPDVSGSPTTGNVGQELTYVVRVQNKGNAAAANLVVRMQLPREVDFVRVGNNTLGNLGCAPSGQAGQQGGVFVTCARNSLGAGSEGTVNIVARSRNLVPDNTLVQFSVNVDPDRTVNESDENNNTASVLTTLRGSADVAIASITIERQGLPLPFQLPTFGGASSGACKPEGTSHANTTVRVRVVNNGPSRSPATTVGVIWVSGISRDSFSDCPNGSGCAKGVCVPGANQDRTLTCFERCSVQALASGASVEIVFNVIRNRDMNDFGIATVDPAQFDVNDLNRTNNFKRIQ